MFTIILLIKFFVCVWMVALRTEKNVSWRSKKTKFRQDSMSVTLLTSNWRFKKPDWFFWTLLKKKLKGGGLDKKSTWYGKIICRDLKWAAYLPHLLGLEDFENKKCRIMSRCITGNVIDNFRIHRTWKNSKEKERN